MEGPSLSDMILNQMSKEDLQRYIAEKRVVWGEHVSHGRLPDAETQIRFMGQAAAALDLMLAVEKSA